MAVLEWTAQIPSSMDFAIIYQNRSFRADSGKVSVVEYGRAYWSAQLTFQALNAREERRLTSMIGRMRGIYNTLKVPAWTRFRNDNLGNIVTNVATNNSVSITVAANMAASKKIFSAGDYITIGNDMFEVTDDVTALANGSAVVYLNKRLRATYPSNTVIEYRRPYCVMRLEEDEFSVSRLPMVSSATLNLVEAL